jgi:hypothetical protein
MKRERERKRRVGGKEGGRERSRQGGCQRRLRGWGIRERMVAK